MEAVAKMQEDGVEKAVGIVMAPHYSRMSIGLYQQKVEDAQKEVGSAIDFAYVNSWCDQPRLIEAQAAKVRAGLEKFPEDARRRLRWFFRRIACRPGC